jgi:hypothetical protein
LSVEADDVAGRFERIDLAVKFFSAIFETDRGADCAFTPKVDHVAGRVPADDRALVNNRVRRVHADEVDHRL